MSTKDYDNPTEEIIEILRKEAVNDLSSGRNNSLTLLLKLLRKHLGAKDFPLTYTQCERISKILSATGVTINKVITVWRRFNNEAKDARKAFFERYTTGTNGDLARIAKDPKTPAADKLMASRILESRKSTASYINLLRCKACDKPLANVLVVATGECKTSSCDKKKVINKWRRAKAS